MNMIDFVASYGAGQLEELKKDHPQNHEAFVRVIFNLLDITIELTKEDPEFRRKFEKVHTEFFKSPECQETLVQMMKAMENMNIKMN